MMWASVYFLPRFLQVFDFLHAKTCTPPPKKMRMSIDTLGLEFAM